MKLKIIFQDITDKHTHTYIYIYKIKNEIDYLLNVQILIDCHFSFLIFAVSFLLQFLLIDLKKRNNNINKVKRDCLGVRENINRFDPRIKHIF